MPVIQVKSLTYFLGRLHDFVDKLLYIQKKGYSFIYSVMEYQNNQRTPQKMETNHEQGMEVAVPTHAEVHGGVGQILHAEGRMAAIFPKM